MIVFFKPLNALIPISIPGNIPTALLIIVCQGRRLDQTEGRRGCSSRAFGMDVAVSYHPGREGAVARAGAACRHGRQGRGVRGHAGGGAVLAAPRSRPCTRRRPTNASISSPPGSTMSARGRVCGHSSSPASTPPASRSSSGRSVASDIGPLRPRRVPRLQARQLQRRIVAARHRRGDRRGRHPRHFRPRRRPAAIASTSPPCSASR